MLQTEVEASHTWFPNGIYTVRLRYVTKFEGLSWDRTGQVSWDRTGQVSNNLNFYTRYYKIIVIPTQSDRTWSPIGGNSSRNGPEDHHRGPVPYCPGWRDRTNLVKRPGILFGEFSLHIYLSLSSHIISFIRRQCHEIFSTLLIKSHSAYLWRGPLKYNVMFIINLNTIMTE